jgi:hypothetical protein
MVPEALRLMTPAEQPPAADSLHEIITSHYAAFWGPSRVSVTRPSERVLGFLRELRIAEVKPRGRSDMWCFASIGAWYGTCESNHNLEFVAVARDRSQPVKDKLALVAQYQAGAMASRLDVGHTVPIGSGWMPGSPLDHVLISLPYLWGPRLEDLVLPDRHIRVLWVVPIHAIEAQYRHAKGLEALERRFEDARLDYLDPRRRPVVTAGDLE